MYAYDQSHTVSAGRSEQNHITVSMCKVFFQWSTYFVSCNRFYVCSGDVGNTGSCIKAHWRKSQKSNLDKGHEDF